ncbi:MAG: hypothetical protein ACD_33C00002G0008 [uncultured bacterium]|nr:MAG: hypothetical protein ACD_33C00002G0008 [uncultured bacterium]
MRSKTLHPKIHKVKLESTIIKLFKNIWNRIMRLN